MEEGERLSKKQLAQENTIKKLRVELAELRNEKGSASASLSAERQKVILQTLCRLLVSDEDRCACCVLTRLLYSGTHCPAAWQRTMRFHMQGLVV